MSRKFMNNLPRGAGNVPLIGHGRQASRDLRFVVQNLETPGAFPVSQAVPMDDGCKVFVMGGLSKLEWMVGQLATNAVHVLDCEDKSTPADSIVERAQALLDAVDRFEESRRAVEGVESDVTDGDESGEVLT